MTPETAQLFFSLLTFVAAALAVIAALPWLVSAWREPVWGGLRPLRLPLAAAVAVTCMVGSLYFSEVANYQPCTLCWYQRILMYSSAIVLVIAAFRRDLEIRYYVIPLAGLGMAVSSYHLLVEHLPDVFEKGGVCSLSIPCAFIWFERFGFVTLPLMALVGFATIVSVLAMSEDRS